MDGRGRGVKYKFAAFMQKSAQWFVIEKLAAQCELVYRAALWFGTKCLSKKMQMSSERGRRGKIL